jgi:hypothetical protein
MNDEIVIIIMKLLAQRSLDLHRFTAEFHHTFKEKLTLILLKLLQKSSKEGLPTNSLYEVNVT